MDKTEMRTTLSTLDDLLDEFNVPGIQYDKVRSALTALADFIDTLEDIEIRFPLKYDDYGLIKDCNDNTILAVNPNSDFSDDLDSYFGDKIVGMLNNYQVIVNALKEIDGFPAHYSLEHAKRISSRVLSAIEAC